MHNYDFKSLNDKEFESMVVDLLSYELGKRIERFKPGKDQGVDGRFFVAANSEGIIQCKHYLKSGFKVLLRKIKNEELGKVKKLKPKKYIIATSLELSRHEKKLIKNALEPYIITSADIYGAEDLNALLGKYPEVENNHYKLWLASTTTLQAIMNRAIIGRSRHLIDEAQEDSRKYVMTGNHEIALSKIKKIHAVILTGEPGIGKTTLANSLCLHYAGNGFDVVCIEGSVSEAEDVYAEGKRQVFYYDDFLGRNYLTALDNREDSHIVKFIRRIQKDKTKRFILTSRTNILNQGKRLSDLFKASNIERNELAVEVVNIDRKDKARILYNHIFFSDLSDEFIEEIYMDKRYIDIIDHKNYNPRLIEFITDRHKFPGMHRSQYWSYIIETLSNPIDIWEKAFEVQIDSQGRDIVSLVVMNGTAINEDSLRSAFCTMSELSKNMQTSTIATDYPSTTRALTSAFLNRNYFPKGYFNENERIEFDLFNPSIGDFVLRRFSGDCAYLAKLFYSLRTLQSLHNLKDIYKNNCVDDVGFCYILKELSKKIVQEQNMYDEYNFCLANVLIENNEIVGDNFSRQVLSKFLQDIDFNILELKDYSYFLKVILFSLELEISETWHFDVGEYIFKKTNSIWGHDEFVDLCHIVDSLDIDSKDHILVAVKEIIVKYWSDCLYEHVVEEGTIDDIFDEDMVSIAEERVSESVGYYFNEYLLHFSDKEMEGVYSSVSVIDIIFENQERDSRDAFDEEPDRAPRGFSGTSENQFIDDLFERDK